MYRPLKYSVHRFRTAVLSVRMFPPLSSMTADLRCWVLLLRSSQQMIPHPKLYERCAKTGSKVCPTRLEECKWDTPTHGQQISVRLYVTLSFEVDNISYYVKNTV